MKTALLTIIITFTAVGNSFSQKHISFIADHYETNNFDVAIFPETYSELLPDKRFTPKRKQIDLAETALRKNIENLNSQKIDQSSNPIIHKNLSNYKRQYFGYIDENGDQILLINALWKKSIENSNWLNQYLIFKDGGSYYWQIKYNISKKKLFDFRVNGHV